MKKAILIFFCLLLPVALSLAVCAEGGDAPLLSGDNGADAASSDLPFLSVEISEEYKTMLDGIPDDIAELLPDGVFSDKSEEFGKAVDEMTDFSFLLQYVMNCLGMNFSSALKTFATLCGLLILSAVFTVFRNAVKSESLGRAFSFCSTGVIALSIIGLLYPVTELLGTYFGRLTFLVNSMLPAMGALYALGGNVGSAVASNAAMVTFLAVCENICHRGLLFMIRLSAALSLCTVFGMSVSLQGISGFIKKTYTSSVGFIMLIFTTVLSMQSTLAKRADSVAQRAAKFVVTNAIPLVGGSVSETVRTLGGSVDYLRGYVGVFGILLIVLLLLPTLINILLQRLALLSAQSVADMLGCENEKKLLGEMSSVFGYAAAVVAMSAVIFIVALTLFVRCTAALGT